MKIFQAMWGVLLELAPFLLLGMAVAGLLHVLLPRRFVHRQLRGRLGVAKAVLVGVAAWPLSLLAFWAIGAALRKRREARALSIVPDGWTL